MSNYGTIYFKDVLLIMNIQSFEDFKFVLGETLVLCQLIEHDVKFTYAILLKGDLEDNSKMISIWSLGKTIYKLEKLDNSDMKPELSPNDYKLLKEIKDERNYLAHIICRDFLYIKNWEASQEYKKACKRLMIFHDKLENLSNSVERVRIEIYKKYRT